MRRERFSTFLCVLEVFPGSRHLLEFTRGSSVHLALGKVRQFSFLPSSRELFTCVAPLLECLGWPYYLSSIPYNPSDLLTRIHAWPNSFLVAQLFLGLKAWMGNLPLPTSLMHPREKWEKKEKKETEKVLSVKLDMCLNFKRVLVFKFFPYMA